MKLLALSRDISTAMFNEPEQLVVNQAKAVTMPIIDFGPFCKRFSQSLIAIRPSVIVGRASPTPRLYASLSGFTASQ